MLPDGPWPPHDSLPASMLLEIGPPDFDVDVDIRYATADNLTGRPIYRRAACHLHPDAASALRRAIDLAQGMGLRLVVFDGFRPVEAQRALWRALPDPRYIADPRPPSPGSSHSRGVAVDLTLAGRDGRRLDMGTGFDDMTELSHHGCADIADAAQRHRALLLGIMTAAGWQSYPFEWWHYQLPDADRFPALADSVLQTPLVADHFT